MSDVLNGQPGNNFWIISGAALVWNLIGSVIFVGHVTISPEALSQMTLDYQEFILGTPMWATVAFGLAVGAGILGSIALLLRKSFAVVLFALSLIGVVAQNLDAFVLRDGYSIVGINGVILPSLIFIVAVALFVYARGVKARGWLN